MLAASAIIAMPLISGSVPLSDKEIADAQAAVDASFPDQVVAKQAFLSSEVVPAGRTNDRRPGLGGKALSKSHFG